MDPRTAARALNALTVVGDSETRDSGIRDSALALADDVLARDLDADARHPTNAFRSAALAIALLESGEAERARSLVDGLVSEVARAPCC